MNIIIPKQHIALKSAHDIDLICTPLKKFGITHFVYTRSFIDGSHINLCNNPGWTDYFYNEGEYYKVGMFEGPSKLYQPGYFLWSALGPSSLFDNARERFGIDHGITIVKPNKQFCDFFYFGSTVGNEAINNFYLMNLDILERFILYFKDRAKDIIAKALKNKISLCRHDQNLSQDLKKLYQHKTLPREEKEKFILATEIKKYRFIEGALHANISPRELDCAVRLLKGKSATLIAEELALSARTVEVHLGNLKSKLNCVNKADLIEYLLKIGVANFI